MKTILNSITFTQYSPAQRAHVERLTTLTRPYRLTHTGAQQRLRADGFTGANVTRIEHMQYAR